MIYEIQIIMEAVFKKDYGFEYNDKTDTFQQIDKEGNILSEFTTETVFRLSNTTRLSDFMQMMSKAEIGFKLDGENTLWVQKKLKE
jgi:hypothetical protein